MVRAYKALLNDFLSGIVVVLQKQFDTILMKIPLQLMLIIKSTLNYLMPIRK